ncbi:hypothetical protein [Methylobacterium sp. GC_Met_2]|nr:hypothetical protein [Methylobacterium sp. GC_Met_2]
MRNAHDKTFQPYILTIPEGLLNDTRRRTRAAIRTRLTIRGIPMEESR